MDDKISPCDAHKLSSKFHSPNFIVLQVHWRSVCLWSVCSWSVDLVHLSQSWPKMTKHRQAVVADAVWTESSKSTASNMQQSFQELRAIRDLLCYTPTSTLVLTKGYTRKIWRTDLYSGSAKILCAITFEPVCPDY